MDCIEVRNKNNNIVNVCNGLILQEIKDKTQELGTEIHQLLDQKLEDFSRNLELKFMEETKENTRSERSESFPYLDASNGNTQAEEDPKRKKELFVEKKFHMRESLLTDLFKTTTHLRTIYNFFLALLLILILNTCVHDLLDEGRLNLSFDLIRWCFGKFPIVITTWMCMFFSTILLLYPAFNFWAKQPHLPGYGSCCFWFSLYALYIAAMFFLPIHYAVNMYDLPTASSLTIVCEQVRLIMKVHAFVRENVPKALRYKAAWNHKDDEIRDFKTRPCPELEKFLYFLFAPTLVYRDNYPRTKSVDWLNVACNFLEVIGCIFYTHYVFTRFCIPVFKKFNSEHITLGTFVLAVFSSVLPGYLCLLLLFWGLLHAWHNAFAEMLRFGDRLFYKDWWNSTNFSGYYRTWNVVVHDWLYAYVYRDVNKIFRSPSRARAAISVFFLSAIIHEYVFIVGFKFFYPVMFFLFFGFGVLLFFVTTSIRLKHLWNIFMWFNLMFGNGMLMALYSMEWYARKNCPPTFPNYLDYLVPRSWTCQANASEIIWDNK